MAQELPEYQRRESIEGQTAVPDFGSAMRDYAASSNALGTIGAKVAQVASQQLATQWGYEYAKDPNGDMLPPITDFDKQVVDVYNAQSKAVLGVRASQLMSDADIEMSKATRLTPDLIQNTNQQLVTGLKQITDQAPTAAKGELQAQFAEMLIRQNQQYQTKMITQQKEDYRQNLIASGDTNTKQIYEMASAGNVKAAQALLNQTINNTNSGKGNLTPTEINAINDSAKQALLRGKYDGELLKARQNGKEAEYMANFAKNKPADLTYKDWPIIGQSLLSTSNTLNALKQQDATIATAQFNEKLIADPTLVTGSDLAQLRSRLTEPEYEQAHLTYLKALKQAEKQQVDTQQFIADFKDPTRAGMMSEQQINKGFMGLTKALMDKNPNMSMDEAQLQVAQMSAAPIPVYKRIIQNKASSTNSQDLENAGYAVDRLFAVGKGQVVDGIGEKALATLHAYNVLKTSMPADQAAQEAHERIWNKTEEQTQANNNAWNEFVQTHQKKGVSDTSFYLGLVPELKGKTNIRNASLLAGSIKDTYETYFKLSNGDDSFASEMTQKYINSSYGITKINGSEEFTYAPLERFLGLPDDATGVIQENVINKITPQLNITKEAYNQGKSDFYWEIVPRSTTQDAIHNLINENKPDFVNQLMIKFTEVKKGYGRDTFLKGEPIKIAQHYRNGEVNMYDIALVADPWVSKTKDANNPFAGGWDVMAQTPKGMRPISQYDPRLGFVSYLPDGEDMRKMTNNYAALKFDYKQGK